MAKTQRKTSYAIEICGELFPNGAALKSRARSILDRYIRRGGPIEERLSDDDAEFFIQLVERRDPARIAHGDFVSEAYRTTREGQVGRHLLFVFFSGKRDFIGWAKLCAGGKTTTQQVLDAMRQSVRSQVLDFECSTYRLSPYSKCPKTGRDISTSGEWGTDLSVVHHDGVPFRQIAAEWFDLECVDPDDVPLLDCEFGGALIAPGRLLDSWQTYHLSRAVLVVVSRKWHEEHHIEERSNKPRKPK